MAHAGGELVSSAEGGAVWKPILSSNYAAPSSELIMDPTDQIEFLYQFQ